MPFFVFTLVLFMKQNLHHYLLRHQLSLRYDFLCKPSTSIPVLSWLWFRLYVVAIEMVFLNPKKKNKNKKSFKGFCYSKLIMIVFYEKVESVRTTILKTSLHLWAYCMKVCKENYKFGPSFWHLFFISPKKSTTSKITSKEVTRIGTPSKKMFCLSNAFSKKLFQL